MDTNKVYSSFLAAMLDYFGKGEGQSLSEAGKEVKNLSDADKACFFAGLRQNGYKFAEGFSL